MRIFLLFLLWAGAWAVHAASAVAILPFTADASIDSAHSQSITQKFQGELLRTNVYSILERTQLDLILQEQGLQSSGACNATDCQLQLGKLLAVDKLFTGALVRFDDTYVLSTRLLDVASGRVENAWFTKVQGSLSDVLEEGAPLAAKQVTASALGLPFATDTLITGASHLRKEAAARSAAAESRQEHRQQARSQLVKSSLLACAAVIVVGGLGYGIYQNNKAHTAYTDYSAISGTRSETQLALDAAWQQVRDRENRRDRFYGLAAFGLALGLGTSIFF